MFEQSYTRIASGVCIVYTSKRMSPCRGYLPAKYRMNLSDCTSGNSIGTCAKELYYYYARVVRIPYYWRTRVYNNMCVFILYSFGETSARFTVRYIYMYMYMVRDKYVCAHNIVPTYIYRYIYVYTHNRICIFQ